MLEIDSEIFFRMKYADTTDHCSNCLSHHPIFVSKVGLICFFRLPFPKIVFLKTLATLSIEYFIKSNVINIDISN